MLRASIITLLLSFGLSAQAAVWNESNQWNPQWETRFSDWVSQEWTTDFFSRKTLRNGQSNPYAGLRLDCADVVYAMRLIYAYENRLPFIMKDPTSSKGLLSNKMTRWDRQNETQKIRNFLVYMFDMMSTKSLPGDTYPVAINKQTIRSGSLILTTTQNHHSWTLKEMLPIGVPHLVFNSTIGATSGSGLQERQSWPNPAWVFEGNKTPAGNAGFRYWRPAAYLGRPVWEVPGYSEEQYNVPLNRWVNYVQQRLATRQETDDQKVNRLTKAACDELTQRVSAVKEGLDYLKNNPRCMNYATYDLYSTPSRDQRSFDAQMALRSAYQEMIAANRGNQLSGANKAKMQKIFPYITSSASSETANMPRQSITGDSVCVTEYLPGRKMDLAEFKRRMFAGLISNNPHDGADYRWGEVRGPSERARSCQSWDNWKPNLN